MTTRLPFSIREAMVTACGRAFWLKDPLCDLFMTAGVPRDLIDRYRQEPKFQFARHILGELDSGGEPGLLIQRRILTELCRMRAPHDSVEDRQGAVNALQNLRQEAADHGMEVQAQRASADGRREEAERRANATRERAQHLEQLRTRYTAMVAREDDPQMRGYGLQDLLKELFTLHGLTYRPPFRTTTDEIDGSFDYQALGYLVEARWRIGTPTQADISGFKDKVAMRLTSTRGLFISMPGFRQEVVDRFGGRESSVIFMDGQDLSLILEGQVSLTDALDLKIRKASQEGVVYFKLADR